MFDGSMTELARIDTDSVSAVVSYYTNGQGEKFEPRIRFVLGEKSRPVKGLTRKQALSIRDAFNTLCDNWSDSGKGSISTPSTSPTPKKARKKTSKKVARLSKEEGASAAAEDAAAAIRQMMLAQG